MTSGVRVPLMLQDPNVPIEEVLLPRKPEDKLFKPVPEQETIVTKTKILDVPYFRKCLSVERKRLTLLCEDWTRHQSELSEVDNLEVITGDIRSIVGQGRLVMTERFSQFEGLVDNCEYGTSEKLVTCEDLQGFWEMIYFQVQDVVDKFATLEKRKEKKWKVTSEVKAKPKKIVKKNKSRSSGEAAAATARREAAKKRLAAAKAALKKDAVQPAITFDAGFFKVNSPARMVVGKQKTPCSQTRRKAVTPKSANFLHGRYLKMMSSSGSSSKKSLNFGTPNVHVNDTKPLEKLTPKKLEIHEERIGCIENSADETAENKENVKPQTDAKFLDKKLHQEKTLNTKTVGTLTETYHVSQFGSAIENILDQLKVISSIQDDIKDTSVAEIEKKLAALEKENAHLKSEKTCAEEYSAPNVTTSINEGRYEAHYKRLLERNMLLKSELSAYSEVAGLLKTSEVKWKETFELFFEKSKELEEFRDFLNEKSKNLTEKENFENQDLIHLKGENLKLREENEKLHEQMASYESLSNQLCEMEKVNGQLNTENKELSENCDVIRDERHKLTQKFAAQCEEMESLQKNLHLLKDERTFEQEEFATEKAFFEEEKNLLQSQSASTETALRTTIEVLERFKTKAVENQKEIEDLEKKLENAREDIIVLREETDMTKVNSRLAIMEQQEEVINCETKLRQLIDMMADFLLKLKKTNSENFNCEDVPLLSDHPLKTPSKSIVVSALLRYDSQGSSQEWSPEEKFDTKVEACLFALVNDVISLMTNITKAANDVASRYELEKKQLTTDKLTLKTKIETLKQEVTSQSEADKQVEISLRRRLYEMKEEKNKLLQQLNYRK